MKRPVDLSVLSVVALAAVVLFRGPQDPAPQVDSAALAAAPQTAPQPDPRTRTTAAPVDRKNPDNADDAGARRSSRAPAFVDPSLADPAAALWSAEPPPPAELTPELIDACMEVAADLDDELAVRLKHLRHRHPERFEQSLLKSHRLLALAQVRLKEPHLYDLKKYLLTLDAHVNSLAREARNMRRHGDSAGADAVEEELRKQVRVQVTVEYRSREDYLCRLRDVVERLERELEYERNNFDQVVEKRVFRLLGVGRDRRSGGDGTETVPPE